MPDQAQPSSNPFQWLDDISQTAKNVAGTLADAAVQASKDIINAAGQEYQSRINRQAQTEIKDIQTPIETTPPVNPITAIGIDQKTLIIAGSIIVSGLLIYLLIRK
jgi:hypothetical protein